MIDENLTFEYCLLILDALRKLDTNIVFIVLILHSDVSIAGKR